MGTKTIADAIKEAYSDINWDRFEDIDRALNWELYNGPLPSNYWTEVEPLDHYEWKGFIQAERDIVEILDPLPAELYYDESAGFVTSKNPEDDDENWLFTCQYCGETIRRVEGKLADDYDNSECSESETGHDEDWNKDSVWAGGEWTIIDPRKELMYVESWKQVF